MTENEVKQVALSVLASIAPEVADEALLPDKPLRRQVDLDSMDWLNFLLGLNEKLRVEIPEADYVKLVTLNDVVKYLVARLP
ncbi:MAG: acyl carrier protein [Rugosibacter sp.]|jgi:acyl carrier protein|nr:acyl carrier protein [Rugosibacter sp.]